MTELNNNGDIPEYAGGKIKIKHIITDNIIILDIPNIEILDVLKMHMNMATQNGYKIFLRYINTNETKYETIQSKLDKSYITLEDEINTVKKSNTESNSYKHIQKLISQFEQLSNIAKTENIILYFKSVKCNHIPCKKQVNIDS